jgi:hypothetical protein
MPPTAIPTCINPEFLKERVPEALPWMVCGQSQEAAVRCSVQYRARSLTRMPRNETKSENPKDVETASARCISEPPQLRIDSVFDDPFEPPPQACWAEPATSFCLRRLVG